MNPTTGSLRHRITLQKRATGNDGFGQDGNSWADVLSCWASIEPSARNEQVVGEAMVSSRTHIVMIRYRAGVTSRMRIVHGARVFEIGSVIDLEERHFWLQLDCTEGMTVG